MIAFLISSCIAAATTVSSQQQMSSFAFREPSVASALELPSPLAQNYTECLSAHNAERSAVGVPSLVWDQNLAQCKLLVTSVSQYHWLSLHIATASLISFSRQPPFNGRLERLKLANSNSKTMGWAWTTTLLQVYNQETQSLDVSLQLNSGYSRGSHTTFLDLQSLSKTISELAALLKLSGRDLCLLGAVHQSILNQQWLSPSVTTRLLEMCSVKLLLILALSSLLTRFRSTDFWNHLHQINNPIQINAHFQPTSCDRFHLHCAVRFHRVSFWNVHSF